MSVIITAKVTPKAKKEHIKEEKQPDGSILYKIYVNAPPDNGKANEAVIKLLAKFLHVPKSSITIIKGHTSRKKIIKIE